jgi:hypothetical protein
MAIRYAMNRQTIASSMLPNEIIENYYYRFTKTQKDQIIQDLQLELEYGGDKAFGHPTIDRPSWLKFLAALNEKEHFDINLNDGSVCKVFKVNDRIYPLYEYIKRPYIEIYIDNQNIKKET